MAQQDLTSNEPSLEKAADIEDQDDFLDYLGQFLATKIYTGSTESPKFRERFNRVDNFWRAFHEKCYGNEVKRTIPQGRSLGVSPPGETMDLDTPGIVELGETNSGKLSVVSREAQQAEGEPSDQYWLRQCMLADYWKEGICNLHRHSALITSRVSDVQIYGGWLFVLSRFWRAQDRKCLTLTCKELKEGGRAHRKNIYAWINDKDKDLKPYIKPMRLTVDPDHSDRQRILFCVSGADSAFLAFLFDTVNKKIHKIGHDGLAVRRKKNFRALAFRYPYYALQHRSRDDLIFSRVPAAKPVPRNGPAPESEDVRPTRRVAPEFEPLQNGNAVGSDFTDGESLPSSDEEWSEQDELTEDENIFDNKDINESDYTAEGHWPRSRVRATEFYDGTRKGQLGPAQWFPDLGLSSLNVPVIASISRDAEEEKSSFTVVVKTFEMDHIGRHEPEVNTDQDLDFSPRQSSQQLLEVELPGRPGDYIFRYSPSGMSVLCTSTELPEKLKTPDSSQHIVCNPAVMRFLGNIDRQKFISPRLDGQDSAFALNAEGDPCHWSKLETVTITKDSRERSITRPVLHYLNPRERQSHAQSERPWEKPESKADFRLLMDDEQLVVLEPCDQTTPKLRHRFQIRVYDFAAAVEEDLNAMQLRAEGMLGVNRKRSASSELSGASMKRQEQYSSP